MTGSEAFVIVKEIFGEPTSRANGKMFWNTADKKQITFCEPCGFISFRKDAVVQFTHFKLDGFIKDFQKTINWYNEQPATAV